MASWNVSLATRKEASRPLTAICYPDSLAAGGWFDFNDYQPLKPLEATRVSATNTDSIKVPARVIRGGLKYESLADELSTALVRGLTEIPNGLDRAKACGARRVEVLEGISQIIAVLDDTSTCVQTFREDQRTLCLGRLVWALDMATGLQRGCLAMKLLEVPDFSYDNFVPSSEYQAIENRLKTCIKRVRDLFALLEAGPPASERPGKDDDVFEVLGESLAGIVANVGTSLWPIASQYLSPLTPYLDVLMEPTCTSSAGLSNYFPPKEDLARPAGRLPKSNQAAIYG